MSIVGLGRRAKTGLLRPATKAVWGVQVRYHSWSDGTVYPLDETKTITATRDRTQADAQTNEGIEYTEQITDFILDVADLPIMPQARDVIIVEDDELGIANQYYQVLTSAGSRAVEPNDHHEDTWRIHTKNIPPPTETIQAIYGGGSGAAYGNAEGTGYVSSRR